VTATTATRAPTTAENGCSTHNFALCDDDDPARPRHRDGQTGRGRSAGWQSVHRRHLRARNGPVLERWPKS
jgi:hypothetical protein